MSCNPDFEAGLAQGAIQALVTAATALESAANRLERAKRCDALAKADRIEIRKAIMIIDEARGKIASASVKITQLDVAA